MSRRDQLTLVLSSETSIPSEQSAGRYDSEDSNIDDHRWENLRTSIAAQYLGVAGLAEPRCHVATLPRLP
jgi:hypothetical protein